MVEGSVVVSTGMVVVTTTVCARARARVVVVTGARLVGFLGRRTGLVVVVGWWGRGLATVVVVVGGRGRVVGVT